MPPRVQTPAEPLSPWSPPEGYAGLLDFNLIFRQWLRFRSTNVATFRMKTLICRGMSRLSNANLCALSSRNITEYRIFFVAFLASLYHWVFLLKMLIFHVSLKFLNFYHKIFVFSLTHIKLFLYWNKISENNS